MLLGKQTRTELRQLSEEASERLEEIENEIEEERAAREKALKAIDNKHKRKVATIACLAVSGLAGIALLGMWAAKNRIQQANVDDATPPAARIVDDGRPPETTEIGGTVIPKGRFNPNAMARVAQSVVMIYTAKGQCSASVVGNQNLLSAAHCEIAPNDTVYVPSTGQSATVVGVAAAAVGDAVILQTDQKLWAPPLRIQTSSGTQEPKYLLTLGLIQIETGQNVPFSKKIPQTTEEVAIIGFPGNDIFKRPRQGREALNTKMKRYAYKAYPDSTMPLLESSAAPGSVPGILGPYSAPDPETSQKGMSGGPAVNRQGQIIGLSSKGSETASIQEVGLNYEGIQPIDTSTQFCVNGQRVTAEQLLTMQFTGNHRCS